MKKLLVSLTVAVQQYLKYCSAVTLEQKLYENLEVCGKDFIILVQFSKNCCFVSELENHSFGLDQFRIRRF